MQIEVSAQPTRSYTPRRSTSCAAARNPGKYYLPMDVSSRFGMKLRQLRLEQGLTQIEMSNRFGIDRTFISDVERGRKSLSLPMLEVIALGLKLSLSDLLRGI